MKPLGPADPRRVGQYQLLAKLGAGGMGSVYLARSGRGRTVAVKLVQPELARQPEFRQRFQQEVDAARRIGQRWTAPVLDADTDAETPWVATGYVAGPSLHEVVAGGYKLPVRTLLALANGLTHSLRDIHAAGLVHRDLKPSNVLITIDGPRVIDFGIARAADHTGGGLTRTGAAVGSPGFMSPEQCRGEIVTGASDVFCLGSVLAFAATGRTPFGDVHSAMHVLMLRIVQDEKDLTGVPDGIRALVEGCLAQDPAQRPTLEKLLELTAEGDLWEGDEDDAEAEPWLPGALIAKLGKQAVGLLDSEDPLNAPPRPDSSPAPAMPSAPPTAMPQLPPSPPPPTVLPQLPPSAPPTAFPAAPAAAPSSPPPTAFPAQPAAPPPSAFAAAPLAGAAAAGGAHGGAHGGEAPGENAPSGEGAADEAGAGEPSGGSAADSAPASPQPDPRTAPTSAPATGVDSGIGAMATVTSATPPPGVFGPPIATPPPGGTAPPAQFGAAGGTPPAKPPRGKLPWILGAVSVVIVLVGGFLVVDALGDDGDGGGTGGDQQDSASAGGQDDSPEEPDDAVETGPDEGPDSGIEPGGPDHGPDQDGVLPPEYLGAWIGEVLDSEGESIGVYRRIEIVQGYEGEELAETWNVRSNALCRTTGTLVSYGRMMTIEAETTESVGDICYTYGEQTLRAQSDGTLFWSQTREGLTAVLDPSHFELGEDAVQPGFTGDWEPDFVDTDGVSLEIADGPEGTPVAFWTWDTSSLYCTWEQDLIVAEPDVDVMLLSAGRLTSSEPESACSDAQVDSVMIEILDERTIEVTSMPELSDWMGDELEPVEYRRR